MAVLDSMQATFTVAAIWVATVAGTKLKELDTRLAKSANMASAGEVHRPRYDRPALRKPAFNWQSLDKNRELMNF